MKFNSSLGIILALAFLQSAVAQENQDTMWLCRDTNPDVLWFKMYLADTFPDNRGQFNMVDTGDAIAGMYVNFDYQFGNPNPGYAGFKFYWDNGVMQFWAAEYDSMVLWHKGPLPGHKVMMIWAQGSAGCGTPINYEYFGQFYSSTTWKREAFGFRSGFVKNGLFELRMLIYNDSTVSTSPSSQPGNFKIDNVYFFQGPPHAPEIWTQPQSQTAEENDTVIFRVGACGGKGGSATYQWKKDGNNISDALLPTYTIGPVKVSDAGNYTVVATNSIGSVTSNAATLTVNTNEKEGCGCGSGVGAALIPPIFFKVMAYRKRKKKNPKT